MNLKKFAPTFRVLFLCYIFSIGLCLFSFNFCNKLFLKQFIVFEIINKFTRIQEININTIDINMKNVNSDYVDWIITLRL